MMIKSKRIIGLLFLSVIFVFSFCFGTISVNNVKADTVTFEMVEGASLRLSSGTVNDGQDTQITNGIRFQVVMNKATKDAVTDTNKLYMLICPKDVLDVSGVTNEELLSYKAKWIDLGIPYGLTEGGETLYYANGVLCNVVETNLSRDFNAIAFFADNEKTTIGNKATVTKPTPRSLYQIVNKAVLDTENDYTARILGSDKDTLMDYSWYGKGNYPIKIENAEQYAKLASDILNDNLSVSTETVIDVADSIVSGASQEVVNVFDGLANKPTVDKYYSPIEGGNNGNKADMYYESILPLKTEFEKGTPVEVEMDICLTGTFNAYSKIVWVDSVYSVAGGERKGETKIIPTDELTSSQGVWKHLKFTATVRNFTALRDGTSYPVTDTSSYGNAVYLLTTGKTSDSFVYKNVVITKINDVAVESGDNNNSSDKYYQSIAALKTEYAEGTSVYVEMDICVTGTFNTYSKIVWVDSVYSVAGGERKGETKIIPTDELTSSQGTWKHITFTATVRNFTALRDGTSYPVADTSSYGNAVYLLAANKTADSFSYKNVVLSKIEGLTYGGNNGNTKDMYYESIVGLSTEYDVGTSVTVEMDICVTGTFNTYSKIIWVDSVWGDNSRHGSTAIMTVDEITESQGTWKHITFTATVRNFSKLRDGSSFSEVDTSSYGNAVYIISMNKSEKSFNFKNVKITKNN